MVAQKRVAIYARVSTVDKGQDPETQLLGLREYAARRAFVVVGEYVDYASGTREDRPQYQALFSAARRRQLALSQSCLLEAETENEISENQWLGSLNFPVFGDLRQSLHTHQHIRNHPKFVRFGYILRKRSRGKLIENQWVNFLGFAHRFY